MSVNIMSLVFKARIENIKVDNKTVTAPLLKLILLALADHCNDDGDGAYPSLTTLGHKTALTHTSVLNTLEALKSQGLIIRVGISRRGTTNYSLNVPMLKSLVHQVDSFVLASQPDLSASKPGVSGRQPGVPEPSLTINESSINIKHTFQNSPAESLGKHLDLLAEGQTKIAPYVSVIERLSAGLHLNLPPYGENKEVDHVAHMIALAEANHPDQTVELFCAWATANKDAKELAWYRIKPGGIWGDWLLPYVPVKQKPKLKSKTRDADFWRKLAEA